MKEIYERMAAIHAALPGDMREEFVELMRDITRETIRGDRGGLLQTLGRFERDHGYRDR